MDTVSEFNQIMYSKHSESYIAIIGGSITLVQHKNTKLWRNEKAKQQNVSLSKTRYIGNETTHLTTDNIEH